MKDPNYDNFCRDLSNGMLAEDFDADGRDDLLCQGEKHKQITPCLTVCVPYPN